MRKYLYKEGNQSGGRFFMDTLFLMNSLWVMVGAVLVMLMLGGFILLETGSTRMKNGGHIAGKTILTFGISSLVFWAIGYGLIFGEGNAFVGFSNFFYSGYDIAFAVFFTILYTMKLAMKNLRVTEQEEVIGLDISEHGSYGSRTSENRGEPGKGCCFAKNNPTVMEYDPLAVPLQGAAIFLWNSFLLENTIC
jgi:hypothetical protein